MSLKVPKKMKFSKTSQSFVGEGRVQFTKKGNSDSLLDYLQVYGGSQEFRSILVVVGLVLSWDLS